MKKVLASILVFFFLVFIGANVVSAQAGTSQTPGTAGTAETQDITIGRLDNPFKGGDSLFDLLKTIIEQILMPIGGVLAVLAFIYSGFLYVTAQGNETKLKTANKALLYTAIGTAVLLGSWVLAKVIENTVNQLKI